MLDLAPPQSMCRQNSLLMLALKALQRLQICCKTFLLCFIILFNNWLGLQIISILKKEVYKTKNCKKHWISIWWGKKASILLTLGFIKLEFWWYQTFPQVFVTLTLFLYFWNIFWFFWCYLIYCYTSTSKCCCRFLRLTWWEKEKKWNFQSD